MTGCVKLKLSYNGTNYLGWQKTKEGKSIEEELQKALQTLLQENINLQAASRTDRGVHAHAQVVTFFTNRDVPLFKIQKGLNALLPKDIAIIHTEKIAEHFHPSLDAISKEYHYYLSWEKVLFPHERLFVWHYPYKLEISQMLLAKDLFLGQHDFSSFSNVKIADSVRTIFSIDIDQIRPKKICFKIIGNSFLYKMVRNLVGTLVYIAKGEIAVEDIPKILKAKDRRLAGITAPAHGLYLAKVNYPSFSTTDFCDEKSFSSAC